jgi:hypothetical protein
MMLFCTAGMSGCGRNDQAVETPAVSVAEETPTRAERSDRQKAAVELIATTGGEMELDAGGLPVQIDLASDRVFADEALVRAALEFPDLKGLRLTVSSVPDATLAELATLTQLEELLLQDASLNDAGLGRLLQAMPGLKRLTLRRLAGVTDEALNAVAECARIEVLALIEMNQVTGAGLERLADCKRLRSLDLRHCGRLSPDDFKRLSAMEKLEEVKFGGPAVNDEIAGVIGGLARVQSVTIEDAEVSAVFLQKLASHAATAQRIRSLAFARCYGVTDETLESLGEFPSLETLSLREMLVTGAFLVALKNTEAGPLPLKTLIARNAFLDDQAVACLPEVAPNLVRLDLRGNTGLTEHSHQSFDKLENLKELKLEGENP